MARLSIADEKVRLLVEQKLVPAFIRLGSVNALCDYLNEHLHSHDAKLYPNRIHGLLADDPSKSVNQTTFDLIEKAATKIDVSTVQGGDAEKELRGDIRK